MGTVAACEPHGDSLTYSVGGTDAAAFNDVFDLDASTGEITVKSGASIDYEEGKKSYSLTVTVTDADDASEATIPMSIAVINLDEPGTIQLSTTEPGVGSALHPTLDDPDGWVVLFRVQWSRADTADGPFTVLNFKYISSLRKASYTPVAADEGKFLKVTLFYIDRQCRVVNSYNNQCRRMAAKTADNAVAPALTVSGITSRDYAENGTTAVATYAVADAGTSTITWSLSGDDSGDFSVSSAGVLSFRTSPDYESPADSDTDNVYQVTIKASDGTSTGTLDVTVTVTDANEAPMLN